MGKRKHPPKSKADAFREDIERLLNIGDVRHMTAIERVNHVNAQMHSLQSIVDENVFFLNDLAERLNKIEAAKVAVQEVDICDDEFAPACEDAAIHMLHHFWEAEDILISDLEKLSSEKKEVSK